MDNHLGLLRPWTLEVKNIVLCWAIKELNVFIVPEIGRLKAVNRDSVFFPTIGYDG